MKLEQLREFRQLAYECLGNAKDATFELADAVMTTRHVSCLGDLALNPLFRRQWSSVYEALQDCRPDREKLMQLYIQIFSVGVVWYWGLGGLGVPCLIKFWVSHV